ncbi:MAG: site-specific DNA-methyltransferase [Patescibacteria group bacterium]
MPPKRRQDTTAEAYDHKDQEALLRPDVGLQAQFKKKKLPVKYRYDPSLDPELSWDINADRERAEVLIEQIRTASTLEEAKAAAEQLKRMSQPFLNWAGKAERSEFTVPTLPLFVHERLSTKAILESVRTRKRMIGLFADPELAIADRALKAYEHKTGWVNRLILGDSLVVMNSLLQYEGLGGQVQMIYMDPPYGVKFGSNFQPFIRRRDVKHNDDEDMTREPEMVQAYRDTWELGLHSYLTYLRDRLWLCRELLSPTGSIFIQISDDNLHMIRCLMDEVFGAGNYLNTIAFVKTSGVTTKFLPSRIDFLVWYARNKEYSKYHQIYVTKSTEMGTAENYNWIELPDGTRRGLTAAERRDRTLVPNNAKIYKPDNITSQGNPIFDFEYQGNVYRQAWKTTPEGLRRLASAMRLHVAKNSLQYVRYLTDFPCVPATQLWEDTGTGSFTDDKIYVVQTGTKAIERCILMSTDPGDLVLDPTCGSGTTAYVAEQWGRRWITIDTSRVPIALAKQRLLTATYDYYELRDEKAGVAGGFKYERKQNKKGEEIGGIVPHITLKSIANNEPPEEEVLVDRPNIVPGVVRVTGPFVVEATIPTPVDIDADGVEDSGVPAGDHYQRMLEVLRRSPVLRLPGNRTVTFKNVRQPAKSLNLHAEAIIEGNGEKPVAFLFGPESGAVSEKMIYEAAREAHGKSYAHLYIIGFACQDAATRLIRECESVMGIPATFVAATMDLAMHDLLKTSRASQVFSVTGAPEIKLLKLKQKGANGEDLYQVKLLGLDVFDPVTMETDHLQGDDVPAWFLDTDYNELSFLVGQAFFPRTSAWDSLKRELKGVYLDSVWEHLAGDTSEPFTAGDNGKIAVKVIDERGNELMVVKPLAEAEVEA